MPQSDMNLCELTCNRCVTKNGIASGSESRVSESHSTQRVQLLIAQEVTMTYSWHTYYGDMPEMISDFSFLFRGIQARSLQRGLSETPPIYRIARRGP